MQYRRNLIGSAFPLPMNGVEIRLLICNREEEEWRGIQALSALPVAGSAWGT